MYNLNNCKMKVSLHEEDLKEINFCVKNNLKIPKDVQRKIYKIVMFSIQEALFRYKIFKFFKI